MEQRRKILSTFMAHSPMVAWVKDRQGRYQYVSPRFLKRFELCDEAILGRTDAEIFPGIGPEVQRNDQQVIATGQPLEALEEIFDAAGVAQQSWYVVKFPIPDVPGSVGGVAIGITALKRAEREKREA